MIPYPPDAGKGSGHRAEEVYIRPLGGKFTPFSLVPPPPLCYAEASHLPKEESP